MTASPAAKHQRAAGIAKPGGVGHPVAERGAQCLREHDRDPVEGFGRPRLDRRRSRPFPAFDTRSPAKHQQRGEQRGAAEIADAERAVDEIGDRGADGGRRDDHGPVQKRMELLRADLGRRRRSAKIAAKIAVASRVAEIHRHRHGVAAGLAERRREDLDDPEAERDFRNLASRR